MNAPAPALLRPFPEWEHRVAAAFTTRGPRSGAFADPYDQCNLGFRSGDDPGRVAANWRGVLSASGLAGRPFAMPRMVHGDAWADVDGLAEPASPRADGYPAWEPPDSDAVATGLPGRVLAVTMADCLTALVWDPGSGTIAAVHAGWRGVVNGIIGKAVRRLGGPDSGIIAAVGPHIGPCCFEVGREVAEQLDISVKTVDLYRARVMKRMQAQTLADLVGMAIAAGLVDPLRLRPEGA